VIDNSKLEGLILFLLPLCITDMEPDIVQHALSIFIDFNPFGNFLHFTYEMNTQQIVAIMLSEIAVYIYCSRENLSYFDCLFWM